MAVKRKRSDGWSDDELNLLIAEYDRLTCAELAEILPRRTAAGIKTMATHIGLKKSLEAKRRISKRKNAGQFTTAGSRTEHLPLYTISTRTPKRGNPSKWIKLGEKHWQQLHHYNWLQAGNIIPENHVLCFIDKNPMNCELDNLRLVHRGPHSRPDNGAGIEIKRDAKRLDAEQRRERKRIAVAEQKQLHKKARAQRIKGEKDEALKTKLQVKELQRQFRIAEKQLAKLQREAKKQHKAENKPAVIAAVVAPVPQKVTRTEIPQEKKLEKNLKQKVKRLKTAEAKVKADDGARELKRLAKAKLKAIHDHAEYQKQRDEKPRYQTRQVDISALVPFKLDNNTVIYIKPDADREQIRLKYAKRDKQDYRMNAGRPKENLNY